MGPDQRSDLITPVHRTIGPLGQPSQPEEVRTPAVSVRRSVHRDYVVCLDCGYRGKTLRRHISTRHGLSPDEYRRRWGLRSNHPLTAPVYSEHRSTMARARGLGRRLAAPAALVGTPKESPAMVSTAGTAKAKSARRSRPVSNRMSRARWQHQYPPGGGDHVLGSHRRPFSGQVSLVRSALCGLRVGLIVFPG